MTDMFSLSRTRFSQLAMLGLLSVLMGVQSSSAQISELDRSRLNQAAFYNYTEQGDVTIRVHVWGAVRFPGLYEIPRSSLLSDLISLAGGPQASERAQRSTRLVQLKLHRQEGSGTEKTVVFSSAMENEIIVANEDPILADGDVLTFEATIRQGFRWRDLFPIVSMVGTIVLILDNIASS